MPLNLPRLENVRTHIVTEDMRASNTLQRFWQDSVKEIEDAVNGLSAIQDDIADNVAAIAATQANLASAVRLVIRNNSWTQGLGILTAADAGSDATITIGDHTRVFGNGSTLAIVGGDVTGLAYSTTYGVYYDDAGWFDTSTLEVASGADTTPTYVATTNVANAQFTAAANRFFVGYITTPSSGGGGTDGGGGDPPGYGGGGPIP